MKFAREVPDGLPSEEEIERLVLVPRDGSNTCPRCGGRLGLYVVRMRYEGLCAACVAGEIRRLRRRGLTLAEWVERLDGAVNRELEHQERRGAAELQVTWDLCRCARCGKILKLADARYPSTGAAGPIHPHCAHCYWA